MKRFRSSIPRSERFLAAALAIALLLALSAPVRAQLRTPPTEVEVKAAFLYHFAQLVTWPDTPDAGAGAPIVVAIVGQDPFGGKLDTTIGDQLVRGRKIRIVRAVTIDDLKEDAHIVFFGSRDAAEIARSLADLGKDPVLTVSASSGFARRGGMIEFRVTADQRVAFDINVQAANSAGLKMSAQLLKLARIVETGK